MAKAISAKSRIAKYRAKRDIAKPSEPAGRKASPSYSPLRFVIQRHDARRLIASGRSLDAIAAGKGKAPTSFITR